MCFSELPVAELWTTPKFEDIRNEKQNAAILKRYPRITTKKVA